MNGAAATSKRSLDPALVREFLRSRYGVSGELKPLPGEHHNYLVATEDRELVLKISAHGQSREEVGLELAMIEHLAASELEIELPRTIATTNGDRIGSFGGEFPARLMSRVPGRPLLEIKKTPALLFHLGECVAALTEALADFDHVDRDRTHEWTLDRVAELQGEIEQLTDGRERELLDHALRIYLAGAAPLLPRLSRSWLHCDVNDGNVLADGDRVVGLVDFTDAVVGPTVGELAIAVAYGMLNEPDPLAAGARIVAGYLSRRPLTDLEREALLPLVLGRLLTSLAMSSRRRRLGFERANYFSTEPAAWGLLARLAAPDPREARCVLLAEKPPETPSTDELLAARRRHIGPSLSVSYQDPLHITHGSGQYLWEATGLPFLDLVNNVSHVGHCHPRVVAAGQRQMATLNTNSRYLYPGLTDYAQRLAATLPAPLEVCYFVASGSEANELALRLARAHTGHRDLLVVEGAYHGHTSTLIDISPYKFLGRGGSGRAEPWVHMVPMPDGYRGPHRGDDRATGVAYGDEVGRVLDETGEPVAGFILESLLGCGGQIIPPPGYLETAYRHVRAAGGVCIADEVQVGFGRVGSTFWAFETQDVVPDVVVLGKPIGNGHPMAAVVTSREIADSFANGMEFFSTFGGNPVSCAIGMAVLDVIEEEGLQERARKLGEHFLAGLVSLMENHDSIGAVRGLGLFLGIELVADRESRKPAADAADALVNRMRHRGVLLSTDGPLHNVIKIKPPLVLTRDDVSRTLRLLDEELTELAAAVQ